MFFAISDMRRRSSGVTPRTMAPVIWPCPTTMALASTMGMAWVTPGIRRMRSTACSTLAGSDSSAPDTYMWPLKPRIRPSSSVLKPFITDMTMISTATAAITPKKEITDTSATPPCLRRALR